MTTETKIAPQNSLLLLKDLDSGVIPKSMDGKLVVATRSCVAIGTLSEIDGETSIMLTDEQARIRECSGLTKVFSGVLETPKKEVALCTILLQPVLRLPVPNIQCTLDIWASSETEPDKLCVLVGRTLEPLTSQPCTHGANEK